MGGSASKQDIEAKIEECNRKELDLNLKLKSLQEELNGMMPKNERIKTNQDLTPNSKIEKYYNTTDDQRPKSVGKKKKKGKKGKDKSKKDKSQKKKKK